MDNRLVEGDDYRSGNADVSGIVRRSQGNREQMLGLRCRGRGRRCGGRSRGGRRTGRRGKDKSGLIRFPERKKVGNLIKINKIFLSRDEFFTGIEFNSVDK